MECSNKYSLFKAQTRYLCDRMDLDLWAKVLTDDNANKRMLIDQVVSTALPECNDAEKVSCTVRAFMNAKLPNELIELLDKTVLQSSQFSRERSLQNLLILTAIQADPSRVMEYINRLDNFDGADIAAIVTEAGLFEEAFTLYQKRKVKEHDRAIEVLIKNLDDVPRARAFAQCAGVGRGHGGGGRRSYKLVWADGEGGAQGG